jgi:hypothetical protein
MIAAREPGIVVDVEDRVAQALAEEGHRAVQAVLPFPGVAVEFVFHKDPCLPCRRSSSDRHEFFSSGPFASGHVASVGWPRETLLSVANLSRSRGETMAPGSRGLSAIQRQGVTPHDARACARTGRETPEEEMTIDTEAAVASYHSYLRLISGFAISRAQSMNSRAKGLRVRFFTVIMPTGRGIPEKSTSSRFSGRYLPRRAITTGCIVRKRAVASK